MAKTRNLAQMTVGFNGNTEGLQTSLNEVVLLMRQAQIATANRAKQIDGITGRIGKAFRSAIIPALSLAAVYGAFRALAYPLRQMTEFESALTEVGKVMNVQGKELEDFGDSIRTLATSVNSISIENLLAISASAARLGIRGSSNLRQFTNAVATLQATTNIQGEESVESLARLLTLTDTAPDQIGKTASALVALGNNFAATEQDIVNFSLQLGRNLVRFKPQLEDVLALSAAFTAIGARPESASTATGRVANRLYNLIAAGAAETAIISDVTGLSQKELRTAANEDFTSVVFEFIRGLDRMRSEGGNIVDMFQKLQLSGIRVISNYAAISTAANVLNGTLDVSKKAWEEGSAAYVENAAFLDTFKQKLVQLSNASKEFFSTGLFKAFGEAAKFVVDKTTDALSKTSQDDIIDLAREFAKINLSLREILTANPYYSPQAIPKDQADIAGDIRSALISGAISRETVGQNIENERFAIRNYMSAITREMFDEMWKSQARGAPFDFHPADISKVFDKANNVGLLRNLLRQYEQLDDRTLDEQMKAWNDIVAIIQKGIDEKLKFVSVDLGVVGSLDELLDARTRGVFGDLLEPPGGPHDPALERALDQLENFRKLKEIALKSIDDTQRQIQERGADAPVQIIGPLVESQDKVEVLIRDQIRLNRARATGDEDAIFRARALVDAYRNIRSLGFNEFQIGSFEGALINQEEFNQYVAAIEKLLRLQEEAKEKQDTGGSGDKDEALDLIAQIVREIENRERLTEAIKESREEHDKVLVTIEAENRLREKGISLKTSEAVSYIKLAHEQDRANKEYDKAEKHIANIERATDDAGDALKDFASESFKDIGSIGDAFQNLANRIIDIWFDLVAKMIFEQSGAGSFLSSLFTSALTGTIGGTPGGGQPIPTGLNYYSGISGPPARQTGGPVKAGHLYRVNEGREPEYFVPLVAGTIRTAAQVRRSQGTSGPGVNIVNNVNIQVTDEPEFNRKLERLSDATYNFVEKATPAFVRREMQKGGKFARDVRGGY